MKVVAFNGSPKKEGNTYQALKMMADVLEQEGIEVEIIHVGKHSVGGCMGCGACFKNKNEKCIIETDPVNEWIQKMKEADGIILGSPVHYSGIAGNMKSFLDRAFYVANTGILRHKVGTAVVAVRRSGGVTTHDQLNHYLNYAEMFLPTSNYWNVIHGASPGQVHEDAEGTQIMQVLAQNMAWLMKAVDLGKEKLGTPERQKKVYTNFVR